MKVYFKIMPSFINCMVDVWTDELPKRKRITVLNFRIICPDTRTAKLDLKKLQDQVKELYKEECELEEVI